MPPVTELHHRHINQAIAVNPGDTVWLVRRPRVPQVRIHDNMPYFSTLTASQGGSTALGRLRLRLSELAQSCGEYTTFVRHFVTA
jgi:hypothetical protein